MPGAVTPTRLVAAAVFLLAGLFAVGWATREDPQDKPYLKILGGGFLLNYRIAETSYGFTAAVMRPLPTGSVIEARFENPAGGPDLVVRQRVGTETKQYALHSPAVTGVVADKPYHVAIRILDRATDRVIWATERRYASQVSSDIVPDKPLTIGPGYARNPN